jgi:hypothetical protein
MNDKKWSYSFSWTQPHYGYQWPSPLEQVNAINELARLDFLEEQVQTMTSYPDAEAIIKKVMNGTAK